MTMRLVPANEQSVGRIGTTQKPKSSKVDFLLEVSQQKGHQPDGAANNKRKLMDSSAISAASKNGKEMKVDPLPSTTEEDGYYHVDEQSLAEGMKMFGSLFTLLEEHWSGGLGEVQNFDDGKNPLMAGGLNPDSSDRKLAQPMTGREAVVINLAEMRHRSPGSAKIQNTVETFNSFSAAEAASRVANQSNVVDENQNIKMAGKVQPRIDIKPTSFMRSADNHVGLPSADDALVNEFMDVEQSPTLGIVPRARTGQNQLKATQMDSELITRSQVADESRSNVQNKYYAETQTAGKLRAAPKDESSKTDVRHADVLPVKTFSPEVSPQQNVVPEARVDQIVRAIVEQAQQPLVARTIINTQELNSNLIGNTVRMNLHPEELGGLQIAVSKRGKRLEVNVSSEIAGTGKLLLEDAAALAQKLSATDSEVEHVQVRIWTADGSVENQELGNVLQFDVRPNGNQSSGEQRSPRSRSDRGQQFQERPVGERWVEELHPSIDSHRRNGAVYI